MPEITPARLQIALGLAPEEAIAFLYGKESAMYASFKDVSPEIFRIVFTVAGVLQMDVLVAIRNLVEQALSEGQSFEEFKKAMKSNDAVSKVLPTSRFQTIYRTNLQSAFMAARFRQQTAIGERKPFWQIIAVLDSSTTNGCRVIDKKVFRYDDAFWRVNYPPRHYGCRARVRIMNERELKQYGGLVEEGKDYSHIKPDPSFANTPDTPFEPKKADYPPDVWKEYNKR